MPAILKRHGEDQRAVLGALANPLLALEHLGYSFSQELRANLELRVRFGEKRAKHLRELEAAVFAAAGERFDLSSAEDLQRVLGPLLEEKNHEPGAEKRMRPRAVITGRTPQLRWADRSEDPLRPFAHVHPVVPPLIEYRKMEASEPRLAAGSLFREIIEGRRKLPVRRARFRLKPKAARGASSRP